MQNIGIIGIGDMGSGLAKNLLSAGYSVCGYDLNADRMADFQAIGGTVCKTVAQVAKGTDAVFIMVMNGDQLRDVIFGTDGLLETLRDGATIILTATSTRCTKILRSALIWRWSWVCRSLPRQSQRQSSARG